MEFPQPDNYTDWKEWARKVTLLLRQIKDVDHVEGPPRPAPIVVGSAGAPPFQNSWFVVNLFYPVMFQKIDGIVYLYGGAKRNPMTTTVIFTLPAGYIPQTLLTRVVGAGGTIQIGLDGKVTWVSGAAVCYFYGICYPAGEAIPRR